MNFVYTSEVNYNKINIPEYSDESFPVLFSVNPEYFVKHWGSVKLKWTHPSSFYYSKYYVEIATDPDFKYLLIGNIPITTPQRISLPAWQGVVANGADALRGPDGYGFSSSIIEYQVPNGVASPSFNLDNRIFIDTSYNIIPIEYITYNVKQGIKRYGIFGSPAVTYYIRIRSQFQKRAGEEFQICYSNTKTVRTLLKDIQLVDNFATNPAFFDFAGNLTQLNTKAVFNHNFPDGYLISIYPNTTNENFNYWNPNPFRSYLNSNVTSLRIDVSQQYRVVNDRFVSDFTSFVPNYSGRMLSPKTLERDFDNNITKIDYSLQGLPTGVYFVRYQLYFDDNTKSEVYPENGGYPIYIHDATKALPDGSVGPYYGWSDPRIPSFNLKPLTWDGNNFVVEWDHHENYSSNENYYLIYWGTSIDPLSEGSKSKIEVIRNYPQSNNMGCDNPALLVGNTPSQSSHPGSWISPNKYLIGATAVVPCSSRWNNVYYWFGLNFKYYVQVVMKKYKSTTIYTSNVQSNRVRLTTPLLTNNYFPGYINNHDWSTFFNTSRGFVVAYEPNPANEIIFPTSEYKELYVDLATDSNFNSLHPLYNNRIIDITDPINIHPTWNSNWNKNFLLTGISKAGDYYLRVKPVPLNSNQDSYFSNTVKVFIKSMSSPSSSSSSSSSSSLPPPLSLVRSCFLDPIVTAYSDISREFYACTLKWTNEIIPNDPEILNPNVYFRKVIQLSTESTFAKYVEFFTNPVSVGKANQLETFDIREYMKLGTDQFFSKVLNFGTTYFVRIADQRITIRGGTFIVNNQYTWCSDCLSVNAQSSFSNIQTISEIESSSPYPPIISRVPLPNITNYPNYMNFNMLPELNTITIDDFGMYDKYKIDVSKDYYFTSFVAPYSGYSIPNLYIRLTGLPSGDYYVRASKDSQSKKSYYSNTLFFEYKTLQLSNPKPPEILSISELPLNRGYDAYKLPSDTTSLLVSFSGSPNFDVLNAPVSMDSWDPQDNYSRTHYIFQTSFYEDFSEAKNIYVPDKGLSYGYNNPNIELSGNYENGSGYAIIKYVEKGRKQYVRLLLASSGFYGTRGLLPAKGLSNHPISYFNNPTNIFNTGNFYSNPVSVTTKLQTYDIKSEICSTDNPFSVSKYNTISGFKLPLRPRPSDYRTKVIVPPQFKVELSSNSGLSPLHPLYSGRLMTPIIKYDLDPNTWWDKTITYISDIYFYLTGISTPGYYYVRVQPFDPSNNNTGDYSLFELSKSWRDDYYNPLFWGKVYIKPVL